MSKGNFKSRKTDWLAWRRFFERRRDRPLPPLDRKADYSDFPRSLARSLAVFQLGESGGGTIVRQVIYGGLPGTDKHHVHALALFVEEECRHSNILAMCVRMLGGNLVQKNWTVRLFVFARRLLGVRVKVMVLLAAEILGLCYYAAIARKLKQGPVRHALQQIVSDKRAHLDFHCQFLRSQMNSAWQRRLFVVGWRSLMCVAAVVLKLEHRRTLRDMELDAETIRQQRIALAQLAEQLVANFPLGTSNYVSQYRTIT